MSLLEKGKQILLLTQQGKTAKEIADFLGVKPITIYKYKNQYKDLTGLDLSVKSNTQYLYYKLHKAGMPVKDIARFFDTSIVTVYNNITEAKNNNIQVEEIKLDFIGYLK